MSNCGGKQRQHGLVGIEPPKSSFWKRRNKGKARERKSEAVKAFQELQKGC